MSRAPKVCGVAGCPADAVPGSGKCTEHKRPPWQGGQAGRYSSTTAWKKLRLAILARDRYTCTRCGQRGTEVDHVVSRANGGTDRPDNLQTLCSPCHRAKTAADRA